MYTVSLPKIVIVILAFVSKLIHLKKDRLLPLGAGRLAFVSARVSVNCNSTGRKSLIRSLLNKKVRVIRLRPKNLR